MLYVIFLLSSALCIISAEVKVSEVQNDENKLSLWWASLPTMTVETPLCRKSCLSLKIFCEFKKQAKKAR
jgi:hypothetical protein